jgi:hypothetical protein
LFTLDLFYTFSIIHSIVAAKNLFFQQKEVDFSMLVCGDILLLSGGAALLSELHGLLSDMGALLSGRSSLLSKYK